MQPESSKFVREISERGRIGFEACLYGKSKLGCPLEVFSPSANCQLLIFAAIHGDEPETTLLLSRALRNLSCRPESCAVVLCANPDGLLRGTRCNAAGVDLNRNFPASNWSPNPVHFSWTKIEERSVKYLTGGKPASEPETQALIALVKDLNPQEIIALHGPLACIDDPQTSRLGKWLAKKSGLNLVKEIGYPTPGSFGSWCEDQKRHVITYELPPIGAWDLYAAHLTLFTELLLNPLEAILAQDFV